MDKWFEEASDIATWAARTTHRKYKTYFDIEDVKNEMVVWMLNHTKKIQGWLESEDPEEHKAGVKKLGKSLRRQADKYCRRAKAQAVGYHLEDEAYYSPTILAEILPFVWYEVAETRNGSKPRVSGGGNPAEGGTFVVQLIDVRKALTKLEPNDRMILHMKFYEDLTFQELAHNLEISDTTAHRKVNGALRRLSRELGGQSPFAKEEISE